MRIWIQSLAVALVSLSLVGVAEAQTTLRYQFKAGEKIPYTIDMDHKTIVTFAGMDIEMKMRMTYEITMTTVKVDDKGAQVKTTVGSVKLTMDGPPPIGNFTINSSDKTDPESPIAKILSPMIKGLGNLEMTVDVDELGKSTNVRFSEESARKIKALGENELIGSMFTPESLKGSLAPSMILPQAAMEKGKSWTQKTNETQSYGKVSGETKYTFEGEIDKGGRKLVRITAIPDVKIEPEANAKVKVTVKDSKGNSTILFDNKTGRLIESVTVMDMKMDMDLGGMTIPQKMVQTLTYRLKDADKSKE